MTAPGSTAGPGAAGAAAPARAPLAAAHALQRLGEALRQLQPDTGFDDLRDALWLAQWLPEAAPSGRAAPAETAPATAEQGAGRADRLARPAPFAAEPPAAGTAGTRRVRLDDSEDDADDTRGLAGAGLYAATEAGAAGGATRRIRLPGVDPLPDGAELLRALRPLMRRHARGPRVLLDEQATAEALAATGLPQPVLVPRRARWFELLLVVDESLSMQAWRPRVDALARRLAAQGGFRRVQAWRLLTAGAHGVPQLLDGAGQVVPLARLQAGSGDRLLLLLSDACGPAWHGGAIARWLAPLLPRWPLALAQLLPPALWSHSALGFAELRLRATRPAQAAGRLEVARPDWAEGEPGTVLPVFALQPASAQGWARMQMAAGGASAAAALLPEEDPQPHRGEAADAPLRRLANFRRSARPDALRLAQALAVVRPITLPVLRLLQAAVAPAGGLEAQAQVLASGLLQPLAGQALGAGAGGGDPERWVFELPEAAREPLAAGLTRSDWLQANLAMQHFLETQTGQRFDFFAYLEDRLGDARLAPTAQPFARLARRLAERFRAPGLAPGGGGRWADEPVAGPGLTVRAERQLPAEVSQLTWSDDGRRLAVTHGLGIDLLDAPKLAVGQRLRQGDADFVCYCHPADQEALQALLESALAAHEAETGRPLSVRVWPLALDKADSPAALAPWLDNSWDAWIRGDPLPELVPLVALTARQVRPGDDLHDTARRWQPVLDSLREWSRGELLPLWAGWRELPIDGVDADAAADADWAGALDRPADDPRTARAVARLVARLTTQQAARLRQPTKSPSSAAPIVRLADVRAAGLAFADARGQAWWSAWQAQAQDGQPALEVRVGAIAAPVEDLREPAASLPLADGQLLAVDHDGAAGSQRRPALLGPDGGLILDLSAGTAQGPAPRLDHVLAVTGTSNRGPIALRVLDGALTWAALDQAPPVP